MRTLILLIPALLLAGCMHRTYISVETPAADIEQINKKITGRTGTMTVQSGEVLWGRDFHLGNSLTMWRPLRSESMAVMPNAQIDEIEVPDRGKGLVEGFLYGSTVGAGLGIVIAAILYHIMSDQACTDCNPREHKSFWATNGVLDFVLGGAAIGTGVGITIGGIGGSRRVVRFVPVGMNQK